MSIKIGTTDLAGVSINTKSNAHSLFDFKWTDHILNEMSWLRSDTYSWHNGNLYKAAYNHLENDLNNSTANRLFYRYKNCYTVGSIKNNNGVLSNFNNNNYIVSPNFNVGSNTWEHVTKFKTNPNYSVGQILIHPWNCTANIASWITTAGKLSIHGSSNGTNWNIFNEVLGTTVLSPNTVYWTKFEFTGSAYKMWLSTDGINYNLECSYTSSTPIYSNSTIGIKYGSWNDGRYITEIDVKESYYKIGNIRYDLSGNIIEHIAPDGHTYVEANQENIVDDMYQSTGVAWYYVIDTVNKRFKLPRINPAREEMIQILRAKGNYVSLGMTDGTTLSGALIGGSGYINLDTNRYGADAGSSYGGTSLSSNKTVGITTDSWNSGIISDIKDSTSFFKGNKYLYFYVGEYSQSQSEQIATLNIDLFNNKADKDLVNTGYLSNCLTEIPQDIKLEVNNGDLTLKAGSKLYVPNGFESDGTTPHYDIIVTESDITRTKAESLYDLQTAMIILRRNIDFIDFWSIGNYIVSSSAPSTSEYAIWWDTTNNVIKRNDNGSWVAEGQNLPMGIIKVSDTNGIESVKQIFNGLGYIGNAVYVVPGVKGLFCNGRNADGTLNSVPFEIQNVIKNEVFNNGVTNYIILTRNNTIGRSNYAMTVYDKENNYIYRDDFLYREDCMAGIATCNNNNVTNFVPKTVFQPLDYSNGADIARFSMPSSTNFISLTVGASGTRYTAPGNGWFNFVYQGSDKQYIFLVNESNGFEVDGTINGQGYSRIYMPCKKGDIIRTDYSTNGSYKRLNFYYAEGER